MNDWRDIVGLGRYPWGMRDDRYYNSMGRALQAEEARVQRPPATVAYGRGGRIGCIDDG